MKKPKRKKLDRKIKRKFQKWLYIRILGNVILSSVVAAIILYAYAYTEVTDSFWNAHITIRRVSDLLLPVCLSASIASLVSGAFMARFLPPKVAGPIYRIEQDLKKILEGNYDVRIKLREHDPFQDLAEVLNDTVDQMR